MPVFQELNCTYRLLLTPQRVSPPYSPLLLMFFYFFHFLKSHLKWSRPVPQNTPPSRSVSLRTLSHTSVNNSLFVLGTSSPTSSFLRWSISNHHSCVLPSSFCLHATGDNHRTEKEDEDFVQTTEEAEVLKKSQYMEMQEEDAKRKSNLYLHRVTAVTPLILFF